MKDQREKILTEFAEGTCTDIYGYLGCHFEDKNGETIVVFRVWAPEAESVSVVGDFNGWDMSDLPMKKTKGGIWTAFSSSPKLYDKYKYYIKKKDGQYLYKADPYSFRYAELPDTSSLVCDIPKYDWNDVSYLDNRKRAYGTPKPINVYEVHLGSWARKNDGSIYGYEEIADMLIPYVKEMGFTHIELMPITEYPYDESWGYQVTGYFAPTFRYGSPEGLMAFIDKCHSNNIGVILDWVPAHFPKDEHGLYEFDGSCCYESDDFLMNEHPEWTTRIFDYTKGEVCSFLISSAMFWIREYHIDGIRVDAVASMLYLSYGRWMFRANKYGGEYNLEAIEFLKRLNHSAYETDRSVMMIAEESTAFPNVTGREKADGLGFSYKWNMGWMNDILVYISTDFSGRKYKHQKLTFPMTYIFSEEYILPFSHDEVVHCKKSLIEKNYGNYTEKFAGLRLLYAYLIANAGKKLCFMGNELAQFAEWDHKKQLDWFLLGYEMHRFFHNFVRDMNNIYRETAALWENDRDWNGFFWIDCDDSENGVVSFVRCDNKGNKVICVFNFGNRHAKEYRIGLPEDKSYTLFISSDNAEYGGGSGASKELIAETVLYHGFGQSAVLDIPPLTASFYK